MAKFESGKSGNPAGRPTGRPDRRTELRKLLEPHATRLIETVVTKALAGDMAAMRMCIDRLCPTLKPTSEPVQLTMPTSGTLSDQAAAVFAAVVAGEISTEEAATLAGILASTARTQESDAKLNQLNELKKLITAL
ncbi:MAG: DUF5681 domain-containing protein [Geobacter sp.]